MCPDNCFDVLVGGIVGNGRRRDRFFAERIGVCASDAEEIAFDINGKTAAKCLRDESAGTRA